MKILNIGKERSGTSAKRLVGTRVEGKREKAKRCFCDRGTLHYNTKTKGWSRVTLSMSITKKERKGGFKDCDRKTGPRVFRWKKEL